VHQRPAANLARGPQQCRNFLVTPDTCGDAAQGSGGMEKLVSDSCEPEWPAVSHNHLQSVQSANMSKGHQQTYVRYAALALIKELAQCGDAESLQLLQQECSARLQSMTSAMHGSMGHCIHKQGISMGVASKLQLGVAQLTSNFKTLFQNNGFSV
jgi:hypothetical protein